MQSVTVSPAPSRQAVQAKTASKPGRVTGKLRDACKAIVWEGQELDEAAKSAGLTTRTLRLALDRPHVRAFLRTEREVFRTYISAQNIHYARKMRNEGRNETAKLGAMKFIEGIEDTPQSRSGAQQVPGLVVQIINAPGALTTHQAAIEPKPLKTIEADSYQPDNERAALPHQGSADD